MHPHPSWPSFSLSPSFRVQNEQHTLRRSFRALLQYLGDKGHDVNRLVARIHDVIIRTILSAEADMYSSTQQRIPHRNNCFELFGFDVLLDSSLTPWVLEVNVAPSLSSRFGPLFSLPVLATLC